jgi:hypothetical protein
MLTRLALATAIAVLTPTVTLAAAGKGKPTHVRVTPYKGPLLSVTPLQGKPRAPLTISGTRFAPSKKLHAEIDCPMFAQARHGSWSYTVRTNAKGAFRLKTKVPTLKRAKTGICNVYVLNTTVKGASWISTGFKVA